MGIYLAAFLLLAIVLTGVTLLLVAWWHWSKRPAGPFRKWEASGLLATTLASAFYFGVAALTHIRGWTPNETRPYEPAIVIICALLCAYAVGIAFSRTTRPRWAFLTSSLCIGFFFAVALLGVFVP